MQKGIDYIGVGVGALIFNDEGKFLMTRRGPKAKNERGKWEIPGGGVEFGETFKEAIKREVNEELGVEISVGEMHSLCDHIIPDEHQHWIAPTYRCTISSGTPKILEPEKCSEIGWFTIEEALKVPLSIVTAHDIEILQRKSV